MFWSGQIKAIIMDVMDLLIYNGASVLYIDELDW